MKLEWDERKNRVNIRKHGFDFSDAEELFSSAAVFRADTREDYGEERWQGIGLIHGRAAVVVFAMGDEETFRIISLRRATRNERVFYEKEIKNRLEPY